MKRVLNLFRIPAVLGLFFFSASLSSPVHADMPDKTFVSRTAEIDGVKLHYTTGGHGTALILLHGYAETSRMWTPILPLLGEKFTVIAPDLPGIGDSELPANGLDMKAAPIRIHALARSLGVQKDRAVGHDIALLSPYANAPQFPATEEHLTVA